MQRLIDHVKDFNIFPKINGVTKGLITLAAVCKTDNEESNWQGNDASG